MEWTTLANLSVTFLKYHYPAARSAPVSVGSDVPSNAMLAMVVVAEWNYLLYMAVR